MTVEKKSVQTIHQRKRFSGFTALNFLSAVKGGYPAFPSWPSGKYQDTPRGRSWSR
jgi:hypothetical protein